jgi:predicted ABC-class ATPase
MKSAVELRELLNRIDHKGYPAYKDTRGVYQFEGYLLGIDHVQGDPFAAPSKVSIRVKGRQAGFPKHLFDVKHKRVALQDYLLRQFSRQVEEFAFKAKGSGKSGLLSVSRCSQEILERSACQMDEASGDLILRMEIGFPANGRTINARELMKIFFDFLPICVRKSLYYQSLDSKKLQQIAELAEDQQYIREALPNMGLAAFVANGAILPRESGISQRPMRGAVRFVSPESMEVTLQLPNHGALKGMGIKKGITLIVGGGYHGKSTLLKALELGVYNHIAGDGREYVITDDSAMKIRAEDGRSIKHVDISMFINGLPNGKDTKSFCTEDASGSTSQAANVVESMEAGAKLFLIDEDTSATNFMIRDELMQRVVHRDVEPITPFIDRVEEIYREFGISSIIVAGSSGSYFHKADCILQMDRYVPKDITEFAKQEARNFPILTEPAPACALPSFGRCARANTSLRNNDRIKIKTMGKDAISINRDMVDLRYVEQLADVEQLTTLGYLLKYAELHLFDGKKSLQQVIDSMMKLMEERGLAEICESSYLPTGLALPRKQEIFACFNRYRGIRL